jgi:hypothetical protein
MKNSLQKKYDTLFHFYFAKTINNLLSKKTISNHDKITLKDYVCYDMDI